MAPGEPVLAIGKPRRDIEDGLSTLLHQLEAFGPTGNHLSERESGRFAANNRTVEYGAVCQHAGVVDGDHARAVGRRSVGLAALEGPVIYAFVEGLHVCFT